MRNTFTTLLFLALFGCSSNVSSELSVVQDPSKKNEVDLSKTDAESVLLKLSTVAESVSAPAIGTILPLLEEYKYELGRRLQHETSKYRFRDTVRYAKGDSLSGRAKITVVVDYFSYDGEPEYIFSVKIYQANGDGSITAPLPSEEW